MGAVLEGKTRRKTTRIPKKKKKQIILCKSLTYIHTHILLSIVICPKNLSLVMQHFSGNSDSKTRRWTRDVDVKLEQDIL